MIKKTYTIQKILCSFYPTEGTTPDHCEGCIFFQGFLKKGEEITGVDCLRPEIPVLGNLHVTQFEKGGYRYKISGEGAEDCVRCCFRKTLEGDKEICLLRLGVPEETIDMFTCMPGEIWKRTEIDL